MKDGEGGYPCYHVHPKLAGRPLRLSDRTVAGDIAAVRTEKDVMGTPVVGLSVGIPLVLLVAESVTALTVTV